MSNLVLFTSAEGNLLVRMLLAHVLSDFVFQTNRMVKNKEWWSVGMLFHMLTVGILTFLFTFSLPVTLAVVCTHYIIDGAKISAAKRWHKKETFLFLADQALHCLAMLLIWAFVIDKIAAAGQELILLATDYEVSLIFLGYLLCINPASFAIRFVVKQLSSNNQPSQDQLEHGGKWIGQFERIIIFTFVLLGHYEAIGFLITGKSIIRFAGRDENIKSEYVLVGTMLSYAIAILLGVFINWLLVAGQS